MNHLSLGISTCPNDTFSFYALLHHQVKHPFHFTPILKDIEQLNSLVFSKQLDVSKVSFHAYLQQVDHYNLLTSGAALGDDCGPLLVCKNRIKPLKGKIALPGEFTTAALLFKIFYGSKYEFCYMPFHEIMRSVQKGEVDAGVIIHESRFTYSEFNLICLDDLGKKWCDETGELIPLGGIAVSKALSSDTQFEIQKAVKASIQYALRYPKHTSPFVKQHAAEQDPIVTQQHINLYVNEYSIQLGEKGENAVKTLYRIAKKRGIIENLKNIDINRCFIK